MSELNNNFEQKDVQINSQEKIKEEQKLFLSKVWKTLDSTSENIVAEEVSKETAKISLELAEFGEKITNKEEILARKTTKLSSEELEKEWDRRHDIDRMHNAFKNTSTEQILQRTHQKLKAMRLDTRYLGSDFIV